MTSVAIGMAYFVAPLFKGINFRLFDKQSDNCIARVAPHVVPRYESRLLVNSAQPGCSIARV